jgi:hypothetical protein
LILITQIVVADADLYLKLLWEAHGFFKGCDNKSYHNNYSRKVININQIWVLVVSIKHKDPDWFCWIWCTHSQIVTIPGNEHDYITYLNTVYTKLLSFLKYWKACVQITNSQVEYYYHGNDPHKIRPKVTYY